jgi:uncharacterized phage protein (TIGR02218 family)
VKTIPPLLLADLKLQTTTLAFLWSITMLNGRVIRGTEHDLDIDMPVDGAHSPPQWPPESAGLYYAIANVTAGDIANNSDMSVDNLSVDGAVPQAPYTEILDVTVDEIEAGLLDMAPVAVYVCNWMAPAHGCFEIKSGFLGAITSDSDGKYTTEVRGLSQLLQQIVIQTHSATCNVVKFGDARCKFNVAAITITGTVATAINGISFDADLAQASPRPPYSYVGGTLTFTSGANTGFAREVKLDPNTNAGVLEVWEAFPEVIANGDAYTLSPGCDRQYLTCKNIYNNLVNNRAYGIFIPGTDAILAGPTAVAAL